jgi:serine/threonine protein kinase
LAQLERICVKCQESYFGDAERCPEDGGRLVVVGASQADRAGEVIDGKVTLLGLLGRGGMGAVYRALQHSMEREVAVKLLHKSFSDDATVVRRFLQEAKGASKLNHQNVITLFDFGQTEKGELYLMMELLEGRELGDLVEAEAPMDPQRAVGLICQVCDGLQHSHDFGLVHRDVKPDNIFVIAGSKRRGDFVKVLDFGIAKVKSADDTAASSLTKTGMVCGTPAYMSPEQAMGEEVDPRSDIYSVGVMLYEMLSGVRPFDGETPVKLLMSHVTEEPPTLREARPGLQIPAALERVVMATLAKAPERRPPSASKLADLLMDALEQHEKAPMTTELPPLNVRTGVIDAPDLGSMDTAMAMATPVGLGAISRPRSDVDLTGATEAAQPAVTPVSAAPEPTGTATPADLATGTVDVHKPEGLTQAALAAATVSSGPPKWAMALAAVVVLSVGAAFAFSGPKPDEKPAAEPEKAQLAASPKASPAKPSAPAPGASGPAIAVDRPEHPVRPPEPEAERTPEKPEPVASIKAEPPVVVAKLEVVAPDQPEVPTQPALAPLRLVSKPAGAAVLLGKQQLGVTPLDLPRPSAGTVLQFKVKLRGYKTVSRVVTAEQQGELVVRLRKRSKPTTSKGGGGFIE